MKTKIKRTNKERGFLTKEEMSQIHYCGYCGKEFYPTKYTSGLFCSRQCNCRSRRSTHLAICKLCGKEFEMYGLDKRGWYQFCSDSCSNKSFEINDFLFNKMTNDSAYWLGYIWSQVAILDIKRLRIRGKEEMLTKFSEAIKSNYPLKNGVNKTKTITIYSSKLLNMLIELGLSNRQEDREFPHKIPFQYHNDFIRGYFDSDNGYIYKEGNKIISTIHIKSSRLAKQMNDIIGGKLSYSKGEWIIVSFDFQKFNGTPKNKNKWA